MCVCVSGRVCECVGVCVSVWACMFVHVVRVCVCVCVFGRVAVCVQQVYV